MSAPQTTTPHTYTLISNEEDLFTFLNVSQFTVLHVHVDLLEISNGSLSMSLYAKFGQSIRFASVLRRKISGADSKFSVKIGPQLLDLSLPTDPLLPGYYLFEGTRLLGWHPCALEDEKRDLGLGVSLLAGFLTGVGDSSVLSGLSVAFSTYQKFSSFQAFTYFQALLNEQKQNSTHSRDRNHAYTRQSQREILHDKVMRAREALGVSANASLSDIKRAYRTKVKEIHPDGAVSESEEATRTKSMQDLNAAREILLSVHSENSRKEKNAYT